ncbi:MAG: tetratricopeptide repeat protein [Pyrinomonadaceae bacterium]|nr:tetratricopeptide repeat protein [Pyrinomonadaceae bacterium]
MTKTLDNSIAKRNRLFVFAGLAALCLIIYAQTFGFDFINLDDNEYVYENPFVSGGVNLVNFKWALTAFHSSNWHPLTWLSHQLDASFFGLNAGGHHAVNVVFHIINSILLFVVVNKLTNAFWKSAFVAALFAVHPAHVESVAWIAERKDVLSTLFWLLTIFFYIRWTKNVGDKKFYWLSIVLFALGLASKPMLVTMPFTLILLDYWALERFEKWNLPTLLPLIKEKIPYFLLTIVSAVITIFAQKSGGAIQTIETISLSDRLFNAVLAYAKYVVMFFYPANLGVWYPFDNNFNYAQIIISIVFLLAATVVCLWQIKTRKYLFVGWFWFLGTLVPVIGILQVGRQSLADRYTYISFIGLSIAFVWLFAEFFERFKLDKKVIAAVCAVVLLAFTALAFRQTSFWQTSETIYVKTLAVSDKNYLVKNNLCNYLEKKNRLAEATAQCSAAIADDPNNAIAYNTFGTVQLKQNKLAEAKTNFDKAVALNPGFVLALANLAVVQTNSGDIEGAKENLNRAIAADKDRKFFDANRLVDAYSSVAVAAMKQKKYGQAEDFFKKSLELTPNNLDFRRNLALAMHLQGKSADGIKILEEAIRSNPNFPEIYNTLGLIYAEQNRRQEAVTQFQKALQINPNFAPARANLQKAMQ